MITFIRIIVPFYFIVHILPVRCFGQTPLMDDTMAIREIRGTLDLIYNFEFVKASEKISKLEVHLGEHPANYLLKSQIIYWRDRPLGPDTPPYDNYVNFLEKAIDLADPFLKQEKMYAEGVFYAMSGYALLAELYSTQGAGLKVLGAARNAYKYLKQGMEEINKFPDFYFSTGLYNYYREKYPELYPFYKSFMWLFASGDKELGLHQLKLAVDKSVFSRTQALLYLFHIYLRYENDPSKSFPYAKRMVDTYPANIRFKSLYTEVLIAEKKFNEANNYATDLMQEDKPFHKLAGTLFKAMIEEHNLDFNNALALLDSADVISSDMDEEDMHYESMILATRARIADKRGNQDQARKYYKAALKLDPYVPVRQEALQYINK